MAGNHTSAKSRPFFTWLDMMGNIWVALGQQVVVSLELTLTPWSLNHPQNSHPPSHHTPTHHSQNLPKGVPGILFVLPGIFLCIVCMCVFFREFVCYCFCVYRFLPGIFFCAPKSVSRNDFRGAQGVHFQTRGHNLTIVWVVWLGLVPVWRVAILCVYWFQLFPRYFCRHMGSSHAPTAYIYIYIYIYV